MMPGAKQKRQNHESKLILPMRSKIDGAGCLPAGKSVRMSVGAGEWAMNVQFDPYYTWLGIPPAEQPPNHYRLLGIQLFEPNADVIAHAADRQMMHLRSFQQGAHSALSQRLLNEVAGARICLHDAAK